MIYVIQALILTILTFLVAWVFIKRSDTRREHRNRSEGAKRGWRRRRRDAFKKGVRERFKIGKEIKKKTVTDLRKENGLE